MKTKEVIENLKCCNGGSCTECTMDMKPGCTDELMIAAEKKLQAVHEDVGRCKKKIADLKKELAERETAPGWISVEDESLPVLSGKINMMWHMYPKDLPAYIAFYGNGANNGVTHWMTLEPPKPKEPPKKVKTYKDVYQDRMKEAFPEAVLDGSVTGKCRDKLFGINKPCTYQCRDCWNQPYPEKEGGEE